MENVTEISQTGGTEADIIKKQKEKISKTYMNVRLDVFIIDIVRLPIWMLGSYKTRKFIEIQQSVSV